MPVEAHAAGAGALQHLLTRGEEHARLVRLPPRACAAPLVAALASDELTVRRRAAGAVCNASADDDALDLLVECGAAGALALHLLPSGGAACASAAAAASSPAEQAARHASLRALERLCRVSATAREQAAAAMPEAAPLLSQLAALLQTSGHAPTRALASRTVASLSRSESRHWRPAAERPPPRAWPPSSLVYYTGVALEPWGPERLETGLGGSETAVLQLASRWKAMDPDREVAVYLRMGAPDDGAAGAAAAAAAAAEREWRGVRLVDVAAFNPSDSFGTFIAWRSLELLDEPLDARLVLLDLHDMPRRRDMSPRRLARVDRLMCKSEFQRGVLPPVASGTPACVLPNGVDEELVARVKAEVWGETGRDGEMRGDMVARVKAERRQPAAPAAEADAGAPRPAAPRLVYTSSYDRGLEHMLRHGWPALLARVPDATLHVYYGWRTHELLHPASAWRDGMKALLASFGPSVVDHGRVGQLELLRAKARAQLLYYVGDWPEIDCIAVREAAMLGCVPLTSSVAVFSDPSKDYVLRVEGDPTEPSTQRAAAARAAEILLEWKARGALPSVDTPTLRSETWAAVARRWLDVVAADVSARASDDSDVE